MHPALQSMPWWHASLQFFGSSTGRASSIYQLLATRTAVWVAPLHALFSFRSSLWKNFQLARCHAREEERNERASAEVMAETCFFCLKELVKCNVESSWLYIVGFKGKLVLLQRFCSESLHLLHNCFWRISTALNFCLHHRKEGNTLQVCATLTPRAAEASPGFIFSKGLAYWENAGQKRCPQFIFTCFFRQGHLAGSSAQSFSWRALLRTPPESCTGTCWACDSTCTAKTKASAVTPSSSSVGQNENLLLRAWKGLEYVFTHCAQSTRARIWPLVPFTTTPTPFRL